MDDSLQLAPQRQVPLAPEPVDSAEEAPVLDLEGVGISLDGRQILHDVNLRVGEGELTGLIGANGAGKTTLLRLIAGLLTPDSGRVLVAGRPVSRRNHLIGYLPQKTTLDPDMPLRARDLVALGLDGHRLGVPGRRARRRAQVEEMLEAVDATAFADARVGNLSGGEQQRVLIAHALISRPRLLLLDEPLANLDLKSEQEVVAVLARISAEHDVAVLVSTHDMNPLLPFMHRVAYVAAGRVASGPTDEVVNTEALSRLYGRHVDVVHVHDRVLVVAGDEGADRRHTPDDAVVGLV